MKLKPYPKYKETGTAWIDNIPEEWFVDKVKRTTYVKGRIGWQGLTSEEYSEEGAYLVTGTDFLKGCINWKSCQHVSWDRYKEDPYIRLKEDDLLITKDGTIGKVAIVKNLPDKATLNSGIFVTRPVEDKYITEYMHWVLNSLVFEHFFDFAKKGATISHLYQETFEEFIFPIPRIDEQKAISDFLSNRVKNLDYLIERDIELIELIEEKRIALINRVVTRGLDPEAKLKDSGIEWIGKIPDGWVVVPFKKYLESIIDYRGATPDKSDEGVFLVTGRNIKSGRIDYDISKEYVYENQYEEIMHRGKPKVGDLLFTTEAPLGEVANVDEERIALAQRIIKMRGKKNKLDNFYLKYYVMSSLFQGHLKSQATGSTALGIKANNMCFLKLLVPTFEEQKQIVKFLDRETSRIDQLTQKVKMRIDLLEEYKTSLINNVVIGRIDVREQNGLSSEVFS